MFVYIFSYDFLYVYDGDSSGAPRIVRLTGRVRSHNLVSTGPALYITFSSDEPSGRYKFPGFKIQYNVVMN